MRGEKRKNRFSFRYPDVTLSGTQTNWQSREKNYMYVRAMERKKATRKGGEEVRKEKT